MNLDRRGFLAGIIAAAAAPAIIRTPGLIMPIKPQLETDVRPIYSGYEYLEVSPEQFLSACEYDWKFASVAIVMSGWAGNLVPSHRSLAGVLHI